MSVLTALHRYQGVYTAAQENAQGVSCEGRLSIRAFQFQEAYELDFAIYTQAEPIHAERAWAAYNFERSAIGLWRLNSNSPGVNQLDLKLEQGLRFEFRSGEALSDFRECFGLEFLERERLKLTLSWALPGATQGEELELLFQALQSEARFPA